MCRWHGCCSNAFLPSFLFVILVGKIVAFIRNRYAKFHGINNKFSVFWRVFVFGAPPSFIDDIIVDIEVRINRNPIIDSNGPTNFCACTDVYIVADSECAKYICAGRDGNIIANLGMSAFSGWYFAAVVAECYAVVKHDIIANLGCFADHYP